jgi:hypothetical protein
MQRDRVPVAEMKATQPAECCGTCFHSSDVAWAQKALICGKGHTTFLAGQPVFGRGIVHIAAVCGEYERSSVGVA